VGKNLEYLSQLDGLDFRLYSGMVLPRVLEQIISCKDDIAQQYLMQCVIQVRGRGGVPGQAAGGQGRRPLLPLLPRRSHPGVVMGFLWIGLGWWRWGGSGWVGAHLPR
jgi:hypothetical protein